MVLRKLKAKLESVNKDIFAVNGKLPKLEEKGYPVEMKRWCEDEVSELSSQMSKAQGIYNCEITKTNGPDKDETAIITEMNMANDAITNLGGYMEAWKKNIGKYIQKLTD